MLQGPDKRFVPAPESSPTPPSAPRPRATPAKTSEPAAPFSREVENLIATWRGFPEDTSRSKQRGTKDMEAIVSRALKKLHVGTNGPLDALAQQWPALVGVALSQRSHPLSLQGDKLFVAASSPLVRSELQMQARRLLAAVRAVPGCEAVRELQLRAG